MGKACTNADGEIREVCVFVRARCVFAPQTAGWHLRYSEFFDRPEADLHVRR